MFITRTISLRLLSHQQDIDQIYLYIKDLYDAKYQLLIQKREGAGKKHFNGSEAFINSRVILMIFIKILKYTIQPKKQNIMITSDDVVADVLCNKELNPIKTELFIRVSSFYCTILFCFTEKYYNKLYKKCAAEPHSFLVIDNAPRIR